MTDTNGTTPAPESATILADDPLDYEEPSDYALRQKLGLRPIAYAEPYDGGPQHPDRRPCPPWCELGKDGSEHEIDPKQINSARHSTPRIATMAGKYTGTELYNGQVIAATIESQMMGWGDALWPKIQIDLRHHNGGQGERLVERLNLSINDAADLVTVLQYFIAQADAAEVARKAL